MALICPISFGSTLLTSCGLELITLPISTRSISIPPASTNLTYIPSEECPPEK